MQSQLGRIANQVENLTSLDATTSVDFEQKTSNEEPGVTENRLSYMVSEARLNGSAPFHWRLDANSQ
jgi:hypothetical protein